MYAVVRRAPAALVLAACGMLLVEPARLAAQEPAPQPQANATAAVSPQTTIQFAKPVPMGSSCGNWQSSPFIYTGTCGLRVRFADAPTVHAILSNNHVIGTQGPLLCPNSATPLQTVTLQPGTLDIGTIPADPTPFVVGVFAGSRPIDFSPTASNVIDAALSFTTPALADSRILNIGQPTQGFIAPAPGMNVIKTGRTTDTTTGTIQAVNTTVLVNYGAGCGTARFIGQMVITRQGGGSFSAGGDSGAAILQQDTNVPVGLLFAGSATQTVANDIRVVYVLFRVVPDGIAPTAATSAALSQMANASPEIARVSAIKSSVENSFFANPDVVGVGVGEGEAGGTAIIVFTRGAAAATAQALPQLVSGVPVRVIHSDSFEAFGR